MTKPFWRAKPMVAFTPEEWESLCDGCGKCCLLKLEYEETGELEFTDVACRQLDCETARCKDYGARADLVPDCVTLTPDNIGALAFMPPSCAYRLVAAGKDLPRWHPLVSGDPESVHVAGMSARFRVVPETEVEEEDMLHHIVEWPWRR